MLFFDFNKKLIVLFVLFQWFGFYKPGQDKELQTLFESELYKEVSLLLCDVIVMLK